MRGAGIHRAMILSLLALPCFLSLVLAGSPAVDICPAGTYRQIGMLDCQPCEPGSYNVNEAQATCIPCLVGANCSAAGLASVPEARAGYFLLPISGDSELKPWSYQECEADVCLGGNRCAGKNTGILCQQCREGYTNHGNLGLSSKGFCGECPSCGDNIFRGIICACCFVALIFFLYRATITSAMSVRHLKAVMLKIVINYAILTWVAMKATGFWEHNPMDGVFERITVSDRTTKIYISMDCFLQQGLLKQLGWRDTQVRLIFALVGVPVLLFLNLMFFAVSNLVLLLRLRWCQGMLPRGLVHLDDLSWQAPKAEEILPYHQSSSSAALTAGAGGRSSLTLAASLGSAHTSAVDASVYSSGSAITPEDIRDWTEFRLSIVQSSIVWVVVLYPFIVQMLLEEISCENLDRFRLQGHPEVICFEGEHLKAFTWCLIGILVYGFGIPALLFRLLFQERYNLVRRDVRRKFGFLYNGFESQCYYFECIYMYRKLLVLFAASFPQENIRLIIMLCLTFLFLLQHIRIDPFDNRDFQILDRMEVLSLWSLVMTLLGKMLINVKNEVENSAHEQAKAVNQCIVMVIVAMIGLSHAAFWLRAFMGLFQNLVIRPIRLRRQMKMPLKWWHKQLLAFESKRGLGNVVSFSVRENCLDISSLSRREQEFLNLALKSTLQSYMCSSNRVQPGHLSVAVREALAICMRTRKMQVEWLHMHQNSVCPILARMFSTLRGRLGGLCRVACRLVRSSRRASAASPVECSREESSDHLRRGDRFAATCTSLPQALSGEFHREHSNWIDADLPAVCVDELHDALMVLWPEIMQNRPALHRSPTNHAAAAPKPDWDQEQGLDDIWKNVMEPGNGPESEGSDDDGTGLPEPRWVRCSRQREEEMEQKMTDHHISLISATRRARRINWRFACRLVIQELRAQKAELALEQALVRIAALEGGSGSAAVAWDARIASDEARQYMHRHSPCRSMQQPVAGQHGAAVEASLEGRQGKLHVPTSAIAANQGGRLSHQSAGSRSESTSQSPNSARKGGATPLSGDPSACMSEQGDPGSSGEEPNQTPGASPTMSSSQRLAQTLGTSRRPTSLPGSARSERSGDTRSSAISLLPSSSRSGSAQASGAVKAAGDDPKTGGGRPSEEATVVAHLSASSAKGAAPSSNEGFLWRGALLQRSMVAAQSPGNKEASEPGDPPVLPILTSMLHPALRPAEQPMAPVSSMAPPQMGSSFAESERTLDSLPASNWRTRAATRL